MADKDGKPEDGHTFEVTVRMRGASSINFEPGTYKDSDWWSHLEPFTVRAFDLPSALEKARDRPVGEWIKEEKEDVTVGLASAGGRNSGHTKYLIDSLLALAKESNLTIEIMTADQVQLNHDQIAALTRELFPYYGMVSKEEQATRRQTTRRALTEANIQIAPEGE